MYVSARFSEMSWHRLADAWHRLIFTTSFICVLRNVVTHRDAVETFYCISELVRKPRRFMLRLCCANVAGFVRESVASPCRCAVLLEICARSLRFAAVHARSPVRTVFQLLLCAVRPRHVSNTGHQHVWPFVDAHIPEVRTWLVCTVLCYALLFEQDQLL